MRKAISAVLLCLLLLAGGQALAAENLLQNGGFEEAIDGWPVGWSEDMWLYDVGVTYLELREGAYSGSWCAMIENVASNDARFVQTVAVEPNTVYRLSGWVKAENCDPNYAGASLSIIGSFASFPEVHDTAGEWVLLESLVRTSDQQQELVIGVRLGDYSADNTGKAYFDDISFAKATETPIGMSIIPLHDYSNYQYEQSVEPVEATDVSSSSILPGLLLFAVVAVILWILRVRGIAYPRGSVWLLLLLAAAVRLYLMATQAGYETDMNCWAAWSSHMFTAGPNAFYDTVGFCDYPPGFMYLLWVVGAAMKLFGIAWPSVGGQLALKFIPLLADLGTIYLLWRLARKHLGDMPALLLGALYAVSPAILVDGAIWGQVDAVLALGLLGTIALVMQGNWTLALPVFVVTTLMKPQALMAAPLGLAALIVQVIPWKEGGRKVARDAGIGLGISLAIAAIILLPFVWGKEAPLAWVIERYTGSLGSYNYATLNTANLYYLLGANWTPLDAKLGPLTYGTWGTILMVLAIVYVILLYIRRRDMETLPFFCALIYIALYMLGVKMHERYLFPAFILLLYAYARKPDWRVLALFVGFSATFFANCMLVLRDTHLPAGYGTAGMVLAVINMLLLGMGIWIAMDRRTRPLPEYLQALPDLGGRLAALDGPSKPTARMGRKDWIAMLSLTLAYAAIAYIGLGSTVAPQTTWTSTGAAEQVVFDLGEWREFDTLYYGGINTRDHTFDLDFSDDGEVWLDAATAQVTQGDCFRWRYLTQAYYDEAGTPTDWSKDRIISGARYVRMTADGPGLALMEIVFRDMDGTPIEAAIAETSGAREESAGDPTALIDEASTVPENPGYLNSTYFDEIYHARTGYEHANGMSTYEWTHPPLGKVLMMFAIKLFGMTPFGWRFMGALMGVLMVPAMYMLGKVLFKRTRFAFLAAFVMAFDMMHLTQTRIATIDSYAVLFIILMYTCMFRYMQMSFFRDGWRTLIPLGLSGLFMGLGCASKWICMYAAVGLAVLFFWSMAQRFLEWRAAKAAGDEYAERVKAYPKYLIGTLCACVLFFVIIPFAIYYFSYIPQFAWEGGLTWKRFWDTQVSMFSYHANLVDDHPFKSPWYEWPLMLKPIYYYDGKPYIPEGTMSSIMSMGNPAVWWVGLATFLYVGWRWLRPHLRGELVRDHRPAMLLLAFAAQFLPWVLVPRSMFIYHYFGSLPFVMLSIVYAFERLYEWKPSAAQTIQTCYMAGVAVLFVAFYPIATGVIVPREWGEAINWLRFLKLPGWQYKGWLWY